MVQHKNSLKNNCIHVIDKNIKNIKPDTRQELIDEILSVDVKNSKKEIEKYIRKKLGLNKRRAKHTKDYWLLRGWSEDESYVKAKENKQKNCKSVYSREFWLERINPATSKPYTVEEADFERNSRRPIRKEYWIKKGYKKDEAIKLAEETKNSNNEKGSKNSATSNVRKITSKRCIEYYVARGYSEKEAKELVSKEQTFFSKKICIEQYGEKRGLEIWQERQDKWQKTLNSKPPEEIARINRSKVSKGRTVSKAETDIITEIKKFDADLPVVHQHTLFKNNKKQYIYDLAVNNKIIEYHGDFWHSNPKKYSPDYINPRTKLKASEKWKKDQEKIDFAKNQGYDVLVIWESEFKENKKEILDKCIQFLTQ